VNHDVYYFGVGFFVFFLFGLKLDLLLRKTTFKVVLAIAGAVFLIGLVFHFTARGVAFLFGAMFIIFVLTIGAERLAKAGW
jgi:hypothetical protein